MRALLLAVTVVAVGCTGPDDTSSSTTPVAPPDTDTDTQVVDTDTDTDTDTDPPTLPTGLNGTPPASALPAPTFTAIAMTGENRTQPDLLGSPTVMWFYPAAMTGG